MALAKRERRRSQPSERETNGGNGRRPAPGDNTGPVSGTPGKDGGAKPRQWQAHAPGLDTTVITTDNTTASCRQAKHRRHPWPQSPRQAPRTTASLRSHSADHHHQSGTPWSLTSRVRVMAVGFAPSATTAIKQQRTLSTAEGVIRRPGQHVDPDGGHVAIHRGVALTSGPLDPVGPGADSYQATQITTWPRLRMINASANPRYPWKRNKSPLWEQLRASQRPVVFSNPSRRRARSRAPDRTGAARCRRLLSWPIAARATIPARSPSQRGLHRSVHPARLFGGPVAGPAGCHVDQHHHAAARSVNRLVTCSRPRRALSPGTCWSPGTGGVLMSAYSTPGPTCWVR